jgi:hypothetical protein
MTATVLAHPTLSSNRAALAAVQNRFGLLATITGKHVRLHQAKTPRPVIIDLINQPDGDDWGPFGGDAA